MTTDSIMWSLGVCSIVCPALLVAVLGLTSLLGHPLSEKWTARLSHWLVSIGLIAAVTILVMMLRLQVYEVPIEIGNWAEIGIGHKFHFHIKLVFDRLSVPFAILSYLLCGIVGAFASRYLLQEKAFNRFFVLYAFFFLGMTLSATAGTIETLFFGWELVGLSSALLIAYFHDRRGPVENGLRVWCVYRAADAAFMIAAIYMHHLTGEGDFANLMGRDLPWPDSVAAVTSTQALIVGLLILIAVAGKSALIPFSGWLPRAMEGPTPSSAVFYGALSVHLGVYLLLRVSPILDASLALRVIVITLGLLSAMMSSATAAAQADVKSSLAYSSLTQVSLIAVEIGLGLRYLALIHLIGHACLRTLQLLRASTLLRDYQTLENAMGSRIGSKDHHWARFLPASARIWVYRLAIERGYLDSLIDRILVGPFLSVLRWSDRQERRWTNFLSGISTPGNTTNKFE